MARSKSFSDLDSRLETFNNAKIQKVKGRGKKVSVTWPHNRPSPASLAEAGFYYNPLEESLDNVTCFMCQRSLDGWEENDIAANEHFVHSGDCPWAYLRSGPWQRLSEKELTDSDMNPHSDMSLNCRLETFNKWPHEKKKKWKPLGTAMAKAGFYYNPIRAGDDIATCCYCSLDLDGWEPEDDPILEHQKRNPDCLFFKISHDEGAVQNDKSSAFYSFMDASEENPVNESALSKKVVKRDIESLGQSDDDNRSKQLRTASASSVATVTASKAEQNGQMDELSEEFIANESTNNGISVNENAVKSTEHAGLSVEQRGTDAEERKLNGESDEKTIDQSSSTHPMRHVSNSIGGAEMSLSSSNTTQDESTHIPGAFPKHASKKKKDKQTQELSEKGVSPEKPVSSVSRASFAEQPSSLSQFESFVDEEESVEQEENVEQEESVEQEDEEKELPVETNIIAEQDMNDQQKHEMSQEIKDDEIDIGKTTAKSLEESQVLADESQNHKTNISKVSAQKTDDSDEQPLPSENKQNSLNSSPGTPITHISHITCDSDSSTNWKRFSSSTATTERYSQSFYEENDPATPPPSLPFSANQWPLADVDAVFGVVNEFAESGSIVTIDQLDMDKSLIDWTRDLAHKSEDMLKEKCENIIHIIRQQGNRAFEMIEKMPVKP